MKIKSRTIAGWQRVLTTGPKWKRLAALVIAAVVSYGVYSAWEVSRENGHRLDHALEALNHANDTNDQLVVVIGAQSQEIEGLRLALRAHGLTDRQIDQAIRQSGGTTSIPPLPSGCTSSGCNQSPQPSPRPSSHPSPKPSPPPSPTPPCRIVNPVNGQCILATPLPTFPPVADEPHLHLYWSLAGAWRAVL